MLTLAEARSRDVRSARAVTSLDPLARTAAASPLRTRTNFERYLPVLVR